MVRFWFSVLTDILCIGALAGLVVVGNGMAIVDTHFFLFLLICLIACFPIVYLFFCVLDKSSETSQ